MRLKLIVIIFSILLTVVNAQQDNTYTLDKCIRVAIENNHDHKKSVLDYEKAKEQVWEAYGSSLFPSIEGDVTYQRAIKRARFIIETPFFSGSFPVGSKNTMTATVSAEQPLFTGAMFLAVKIAKTFAEISEKSVEYSEGELIVGVKDAFYTYLLANSLVDLAQLQLQRAEENLKNTKLKYNAGLVSEYDYIKANVQHQNLIPALTEAKNQRKLALNNLKLILGVEFDDDIKVVGSFDFNEIDAPDFEDGLKTVFEKNDLIKQLELQTELTDLTKSYQFTQHLPKLTAFGNWQTQAQEEDARAFSNWRYFNAFTVGVSLKVPIFKGFTLDSKVEQAEIDLKISRENLASTKNAVRNEYENLLLKIEKTKEQISAYKSAVEESRRGYDIAVKRFDSGLGTQLEVTDALVSVTNSEVNLLRAKHEYFVDAAKLDLLLGKNYNEIIN